MDLERALETQQVKLLRLLTGWFALVVLISGGPLTLALPRWARSFLHDMLIRAENAAQCLVLVSARLQTKDAWALTGGLPSAFVPVHPCDTANNIPSAPELIRRMKTLRRLLQDLPRRERRLLRKVKACDDGLQAPLSEQLKRDMRKVSGRSQWDAPPSKRPPDKKANAFINHS